MLHGSLAFVALLTTARRTVATMSQPRFTVTYVSVENGRKGGTRSRKEFPLPRQISVTTDYLLGMPVISTLRRLPLFS